MKRRIFLLTIYMLCIGHANAQVYKCKDEKGKFAYSDTPCAENLTKTVATIPISQAATETPSESPLSRQLDTAVRRAIAEGDLDHAGRLAVTAEHWEWISAAKKAQHTQPVFGRTEADLSAEKGGSFACQQAKRDYEFEAGAYKQEQNAIDAKRSIMHAACGIKEPTQIKINNRTEINQRIKVDNRKITNQYLR